MENNKSPIFVNLQLCPSNIINVRQTSLEFASIKIAKNSLYGSSPHFPLLTDREIEIEKRREKILKIKSKLNDTNVK